MQLRVVAGLLLGALLATPALAQVVDLVSEAEAARDRAAAVRPMPKSAPAPGAPRIEIAAPDLGTGTLSAPFPIVVRFVAMPPHRIDPDSVRVLYGRLGLDITRRILAAAHVTADGIDVPSARVPQGSHRLTIEVRDDADNIARREIAFEVGG